MSPDSLFVLALIASRAPGLQSSAVESSISWSASSECPQREDLLRGISRRLGRSLHASEIHVHADVRRMLIPRYHPLGHPDPKAKVTWRPAGAHA